MQDYAKRARDEFLILDNLPKEWREIVHEFGGNNTMRLFRSGFGPLEAKSMLAAQRAAAGL